MLTIQSYQSLPFHFLMFSCLMTWFIWLRWAFNIYDKDGSGDIELSEMVDIFVLIYTMQVSWGPPTMTSARKIVFSQPLTTSWGGFRFLISFHNCHLREVLKKMLRFRQKRWVWLKLCSNSIDSTQIIYVFALLQISKVFSALDKDNDGGIGVDEFVTVCFRKVNFRQICYIFTILDVIVFCIPLYSGMSRKRGAQVSFGSRWCCINLFVLISLLRWLALLWSRKSPNKPNYSSLYCHNNPWIRFHTLIDCWNIEGWWDQIHSSL